ncbi:hypothetical protein CBL_12327 [Carabus blaptoides fortunei]
MDKARKLRTVLRTAFTRVANQLESALTMENLDFIEIHSYLEMLDKKYETLQTVDKEILDLMLEDDSSEDDLSNELKTSDDNIPAIYNGPWTGELIKMGIKLADTSDSKSVELLIGADVAGKLSTGNRQILKSGLVAFETLLGWTVVGKTPRRGEQTNTIMTMTSLLTTDMIVTELWQLDILGITDPGEKKNFVAPCKLCRALTDQNSLEWRDLNASQPNSLSLKH